MKILVADDEKNLRAVLSHELSEEGHEISEADSGSEALGFLEKDDYDVLLLDLNMPGTSGMEVLKKMKGLGLPAEVVILTGHATISTAVEAMKLGAYDYVSKPFSMDELKATIQKAYEKRRLVNENLILKTRLQKQHEAYRIVTKSPLILDILEKVRRIAQADFPVLILGESGVGKELFAKAVHDATAGREGPFIPINCGAIPETLLESELFGHERGAFTGAAEKRVGFLDIANNGTLFLDEIGELRPQLQVKLLRVIESKRFFRVGGTREVAVDVKFLSATNKDLKTEAEKGNFRADLFYRISALVIHIPPLRERREDIPLLIEHIVQDSPHLRHKRFSESALRVLSDYSWPGNVRELQNVIHRVLLLSKGDVIVERDLPEDLVKEPGAPGKRLEDIERDHILRVLAEVDGRKRKAADILGIDPKTLYRKLVSYGITE